MTRPVLADLTAARERLEGVSRVTPVFSSGTLGGARGARRHAQGREPPADGPVQDPRRLQHDRAADGSRARLGRRHRERREPRAGGRLGRAQGRSLPRRSSFPRGAPMAKVEAARGYGATVVLGGEGYDDGVAAARSVEETGATFVHAFEDARVVAGQGTLGSSWPSSSPTGREPWWSPSGAAGSRQGSRSGCAPCGPRSRWWGYRPRRARPSRARADRADNRGRDRGQASGRVDRDDLRDLLDEVVVVDDEEISEAIVLLLERAKLVVEGAGAAPVAAVLGGRAGRRARLRRDRGWQHRRDDADVGDRFGLTSSGRYLVVRIVIPDRPGQLANIVGVIAAERANVLAVTHYREGRSIGVLETEAELTLETRGEEHSQLLVEALVDRRVHRAPAALRGGRGASAARGCDRAAAAAPFREAAVDDGTRVVATGAKHAGRERQPAHRSRRS